MTRCRGTYPVSISSHYFYSGAFYRNGRSAEPHAPPSIYEHDGMVSRSHSLPLPRAALSLFRSPNSPSPADSPLLRDSRASARSRRFFLFLARPFFGPFHSRGRSTADLHTFFDRQLSVIRRSTWIDVRAGPLDGRDRDVGGEGRRTRSEVGNGETQGMTASRRGWRPLAPGKRV